MGYTLPVIKHLCNNSDWIEDKDILTLGTLYPYIHNRKSMYGTNLADMIEVPREDFSRHLLREKLKAKSVTALDVDDYQGSELIINLNKEITDVKLKSAYDTILDFGTLEHLSNLSTAIENIFYLLKQGGNYCFSIPANNWLDHGFFQLSPTFFIDLCEKNKNLQIVDMYLGTGKHLVPMNKVNKYVKRAFENTSDRVVVGGVIKKISDGIDLDLMQSKYRSAYGNTANNEESDEVIRCLDELSIPYKLRGLVSKIPALSLSMKLCLLKV